MKDKIPLRGFWRIQIGEDNPDGSTKIVGDSGWIENQIVNLGWRDYVFSNMHEDLSDSTKQIKRLILGTGSAPAAAATSLPGETVRSSDIDATASASTKLRFTTNFASGDHPTGTPTIANAGLINDTASAGTIFCGATYSGSQWQSNQGVSCTYDLDVS